MFKRRVRVFVDAEVLVAPHFSGIGHYTLELLRGLDRLVENRNDISVELGVFFKQVPKIRSYGFRNFKIRRSPLPLRITNALKIRGLQPPYDLLFGKRIYLFPNFTAWPTLFSPTIPIIYDLVFECYPQYVEPRNRAFLSSQVAKAAHWADKVITISQNSQKEIAEFYRLPKDKVAIIYPGIDQSELFKWPASEVEKVKRKYGIKGQYILFVGNLEPRKNLKNILLAYEQLDKKLRDIYSLLLVGARGWLDDEIHETITRLRKDGNRIQTPNEYVQDKDRAAIFSGASLFVFPSLYEGFGIPPLEAMACGVPTITSNNSSLPEAVGSAAITVDAQSVGKLAQAMTQALSDEELQARMIEKGYEQVDKFSWDNEARKLLDMLLEMGK